MLSKASCLALVRAVALEPRPRATQRIAPAITAVAANNPGLTRRFVRRTRKYCSQPRTTSEGSAAAKKPMRSLVKADLRLDQASFRTDSLASFKAPAAG